MMLLYFFDKRSPFLTLGICGHLTSPPENSDLAPTARHDTTMLIVIVIGCLLVPRHLCRYSRVLERSSTNLASLTIR